MTHSIHVELCVALLTAQTSCDRRAGNRIQHNLHLINYNDLFIKRELPPQSPPATDTHPAGNFHNRLQRCPLHTFCCNSWRPKDAVLTVSEEGGTQVCRSGHFLDDSEVRGKIFLALY